MDKIPYSNDYKQQALALIRWYMANQCLVTELQSISDDDLFFCFLENYIESIIDNCFQQDQDNNLINFNWNDIEWEVYCAYRQYQMARATSVDFQ